MTYRYVSYCIDSCSWITVYVNEVLLPPHALALVVTVIVPDIGALVAFVVTKLGYYPYHLLQDRSLVLLWSS